MTVRLVNIEDWSTPRLCAVIWLGVLLAYVVFAKGDPSVNAHPSLRTDGPVVW